MLIIHTSNRLESLAESLAEVMRGNPLPPLEAETVVTQSTGMSRWLALTLAEKLGVAANIHFPFPAKFATGELARLFPSANVAAFLERDILPWRIHAVLDELLEENDFSMLRNYAEGDDRKKWDLCKQLAATFDRYIAHRPQMLREWDAGKFNPEHAWQARLWKTITRGSLHPAALLQQASRSEKISPASRCAIFGLSSLAPTYLEFLQILARHRETHLFMLAPTRHYWGDVQSAKEKVRFLRWCERRGIAADSENIEEGHPLLASLGKVGRDFHDALIDLPAKELPEQFHESSGDTLLACLQNDILDLRPLEDRGEMKYEDRSIQFHNCHSPLREMEALHDQLLALFEADRTLTPRDVLVAVPDIEAYAPFIDSVFGSPETESVRFPYSVADRELRAESGVADAFLRILELADTRLPATTVLALIENAAVHRKFGIDETELESIRQWISQSGIRWGRDATHRAECGLPASNEHTWQFGLDRLVLGFALPGDGAELFHEILPDPTVEGSLAVTLGKFSSLLHVFFQTCAAMKQPRTAAEWTHTLRTALTELCESDHEFASEWREVAEAISRLQSHAAEAGHEGVLPFSIIRECAANAVSGGSRGSGFLRGGITFCSLKPMRAIPHRIICLAGMNDGAFPRQDRPASFDITAAQPRPGDRLVRDDDRYLFLEALLSARDRLLISYCGQSPRDNSPMPPSVVVVELLEMLGHAYKITPESLVTKHRLQPFSPAYFSSGPLFSYSATNATGAVAHNNPQPNAPFAAEVSKSDISPELTLERLIYSLTKASQFFAKERLGIALPYDEAQPSDTEPMEISGLRKYDLESRLLESHLAGKNSKHLGLAAAAAGELPHGYAGIGGFEEINSEAAWLSRQANELLQGKLLPPVAISVSIGDWTLAGNLTHAKASGVLQMRPAKLGGADLITGWIKHLALCAAQPEEIQPRTLVIGSDQSAEFNSLHAGDAKAILHQLITLHTALYSRPLPLFPKTSYAFASYELDSSNRKKTEPAAKAAATWLGGRDVKGEALDKWNALVWRDCDNPLGDEFQSIAILVFEPLLKHCTITKH